MLPNGCPFLRHRLPPAPIRLITDCHSTLGGEHGERIAFVNDRFATAFGGDPKDRH